MFDLIRQILGAWAPEWLIYLIGYLIITTILIVVAPLTMMMMVWFERRAVAYMQDRMGPNRVGPQGLLQSVADGVKMFTKEDVVPRGADPWIHLLAPVVVVAPIMFMLAVLPWGRGLVPVDINVAVLFVIAVSSVSAVGLVMAGWGSNNKFALLGAMRAVAQMVSYEIPAVLTLVAMVLIAGTMSLAQLPELQAGLPIVGMTIPGTPDLGLGWYVFTPIGLLGFVIFYMCVLSEGERPPFDIPEAESELVAGYMTEYSGMKFAVFFIGQFVLNYILSMIAAIVFLGGWQGPGVAALISLGDAGVVAGTILSVLYLQLKTWFLFFVMIWIRGTFPRLRVDQLMAFAWKFLVPLSLINILSAGLWVAVMQWGATESWTWGLTLFGTRVFGWLEALPQGGVARQLVAILVTLLINGAGVLWILRITNRSAEELLEEFEQEQSVAVSGAGS
jgi:NADH-quinone oxidoreductase subunit H